MIYDSDIKFSDDIAELVSDELGISKDMVLHHIDFLAHWIKKLTNDPEILTIRIPHLGRMYLNVSKTKEAVSFMSSLPDDTMTPNMNRELELNIKRLENFGKEFEGHRGYNRHKKKAKFTNHYFTKGMSPKELEEWQNKSE